MDLSKLPKLSNTSGQQQPPSDASASGEASPTAGSEKFCMQCGQPIAPGMKFCGSCGAPTAQSGQIVEGAAAVGAEVWIAGVLGIIFMLLGKSYGGYLLATLTGRPHHTGVEWGLGGPKVGEVPYWELVGMTAYTDSGLFLFGLAMVFEAIALFAAYGRIRGAKVLVGIALFTTVVATLYNLNVAGKFFSSGGLPIISLLAVAFGVYMAIYQLRLLQNMIPRPGPKTPNPA